MGKIILGWGKGDQIAQRRVAGGDQVSGRVMVHGGMRHRPHDGEEVAQGGQAWQVLGDPDARHARGNGFELPPNLRRRQRFHVPNIELTRAAVQQEQHAGLGDRFNFGG